MERSSGVAEEWKPTATQELQWALERRVSDIINQPNTTPKSQALRLELQRDNHIEYLMKSLRDSTSMSIYDASRPWMCYWILHSIALLGKPVDDELENKTIDLLSRCQDQHGGYGGGPGQMPHLLPTYAAVCSLITLGGYKSLLSINREKIYSFLRRMKHKSGGFSVHDGGEVDVRACYTAISVASALNILDQELIQGVGDYILSCQTYEGGIAGEPGSEAQGGYTFCGLATMILINEVNRLDLASLTDWLVFRQGVGGGFMGRTNKLVDGCYSFWQGGAAVLIQRLHEAKDLFQSRDLQQYILLCSQEKEGGLRDKPGKRRDQYHTCYCLSGLAVAQYQWSKDADSAPLPGLVLGPYSNLLEPINPLHNLVLELYDEAREFFTRAL